MSLKDDVKDFQSLLAAGKAMEAFEKYYADNITMQENENEPMVGKDANREREKALFDGITEFRGMGIKSYAVNEEDGIVMTESWMDFTHKDYGVMKGDQVSVQRWQDGKIVSEKFYYNS